MPKEKRYTILCLGDSYTIGEAVQENDRFPMQAIALLKKDGLAFEQPVIIAKTGWTTDELMTAIDEKNLQEQFDIVTLLIGVNNQYRRRDTNNYRKEFRQLLKKAIEYAGGKSQRVFVLSIPDWGVTPFAQNDRRGAELIGREIDLFNSVNKEESAAAKVNYLDIAPISREARNHPELIAGDGLHPSAKMYEDWARLLAPEIKEALNR